MLIERLDIPDVLLVTPRRHGDARGYFAEVFRADRLGEFADQLEFVQDNESRSAEAGTLRGLHFQSEPFAQAKLVRVVRGSVFDVAVDIRQGSPTFGRHVARTLSAESGTQLFIPSGFAHGLCTLEPDTVVTYKVSAYYSGDNDKGLAWDDPALGITWPVAADKVILSAKDRTHPRLQDLPAYFTYRS
jgi:dTDP-4-dehydrorhamnose 3,5-epimerase